MKTLKHIHVRPAGWIAIAIGFTHFVVTLLEAQCVLWFLGGSRYSMFWDETFPAVLWFPASLFMDPTDITVPMLDFPLFGAWLSLFALCALSAAWGLYAYCVTRMVVSPDPQNRKLIAAFGGYALLIGLLWVLAIPGILALFSLIGAVAALCSLVAAVGVRRSAWPAMLFIAANMAVAAYFSFTGWVLSTL